MDQQHIAQAYLNILSIVLVPPTESISALPLTKFFLIIPIFFCSLIVVFLRISRFSDHTSIIQTLPISPIQVFVQHSIYPSIVLFVPGFSIIPTLPISPIQVFTEHSIYLIFIASAISNVLHLLTIITNPQYPNINVFKLNIVLPSGFYFCRFPIVFLNLRI